MPAPTKKTGKPVRQLLVIVAIMVLGHACMYRFRFAPSVLNHIFVTAYLLAPFLAVKPLLRLRQRPRVFGWILLTPLLLLSPLLLFGELISPEHTQPLQTFQQGSSTVELGRYENGGAVGLHGVYLEQRRLIVPGLYIVRSIDFFNDARDVTLFVDGPYKVRVHVKGNYDSNDFEVDKVFDLKPWVYF